MRRNRDKGKAKKKKNTKSSRSRNQRIGPINSPPFLSSLYASPRNLIGIYASLFKISPRSSRSKDKITNSR